MAWDDWGNTDWLDWSGGGQGMRLSDATPDIDWSSFTAGGPGSWAGQEMTDWANGGGGGSTWLQTILGGLGSIGSFLGKNAGTLGPLLSGAGSLAGGALGANASRDAARLQANALNRGLDLQTAQWLQQQANQAPWLQAGQQALPQLQQLAGQGPEAPFQPGAAIDPRAYGMPDATPRWTPQGYSGPQAVNAADYRWTPGQGPRAQDYRYTPGAVPTLSGQELLANDPGVQFRLDEGRNALEASAAARGGALSGPALAALQRQGQELSSQEYGSAWNRAAQQAQMREGWAQQASQLGFGQAMSEAQLREQLAQQASQQGFGQALQAQGQQYTQGLSSQQYLQQQQQKASDDYYNRVMQQMQWTVGQDQAANQTNYERQLAAYNSRLQNQGTQWNRLAGLAGLGQTTAGQLGTQGAYNTQQMNSLLAQLGSAQAMGTLGSQYNWNSALGGGTSAIQNLLKGLSA